MHMISSNLSPRHGGLFEYYISLEPTLRHMVDYKQDLNQVYPRGDTTHKSKKCPKTQYYSY